MAGRCRLALRGLMAIPEPGGDVAAMRRCTALRALLSALQREPGYAGLDTLSMGMSADLEAAIAEGATIVRVGTAILVSGRLPSVTAADAGGQRSHLSWEFGTS